ELRREHASEARPDLGRIHPSWWVRALQDESPAVRRAVARHVPGEVGHALRAGLSLTGDDLTPDRPAYPEAVQWVLALWAERLVGGPPARPEAPSVLAALTRISRSSLFRLVSATGLAKLSYALSPEETKGIGDAWRLQRPRHRDRLQRFQALWPEREEGLVRLARADLAVAEARGDRPLQPLQRLGLITIGRLLTIGEPHRV